MSKKWKRSLQEKTINSVWTFTERKNGKTVCAKINTNRKLSAPFHKSELHPQFHNYRKQNWSWVENHLLTIVLKDVTPYVAKMLGRKIFAAIARLTDSVRTHSLRPHTRLVCDRKCHTGLEKTLDVRNWPPDIERRFFQCWTFLAWHYLSWVGILNFSTCESFQGEQHFFINLIASLWSSIYE